MRFSFIGLAISCLACSSSPIAFIDGAPGARDSGTAATVLDGSGDAASSSDDARSESDAAAPLNLDSGITCTGESSPVPIEPPFILQCADRGASLDDTGNFVGLARQFGGLANDIAFEYSSAEVIDGRLATADTRGEFTHPEVDPAITTFVGTEDASGAEARLAVCASVRDGLRDATFIARDRAFDLRCAFLDDDESGRGFCSPFGFPDYGPITDRPIDWSFMVSFLGEPSAERVSEVMDTIRAIEGVTRVEELSGDPLWIYRVDVTRERSASDVRLTILRSWCTLDASLQVFTNTPIAR